MTPLEFTTAAVERSGAEVLLSTQVTGVLTDASGKVTGVETLCVPSGEKNTLPADAVCVATGPWGCAVEDWFDTVTVPMEGIKSTSVVWPAREGNDAAALFCNEDPRFDTHLEIYPRPVSFLCLFDRSNTHAMHASFISYPTSFFFLFFLFFFFVRLSSNM